MLRYKTILVTQVIKDKSETKQGNLRLTMTLKIFLSIATLPREVYVTSKMCILQLGGVCPPHSLTMRVFLVDHVCACPFINHTQHEWVASKF